MSVKIAVIGCGLMGSGVASLAAPEAEMVLIDREADKARALAEKHHGTGSADLRAAAAAEIICVVLPAPAIEEAFWALAGCARPGAILLDMATKGVIPPGVKQARPDLRCVEAKIVGSGIGVSLGLRALLAVNTDEGSTLAALRSALPGFGRILPGDPSLVARVNAVGAYWGIRAAVETEEELRGMGLPEDWAKAASGCLIPGSTLGYSQDRMGQFNREIAARVRKEIADRKEE